MYVCMYVCVCVYVCVCESVVYGKVVGLARRTFWLH